MLWAQRGRDASMAAALLAAAGGAQARPAGGGGSAGAPVVLLAGNHHVRRDYGVPQFLRAPAGPPLRVLSVAFAEPGAGADGGAPYDIVWTTPAAARDDPCKALVRPPPARTAPP
jgi:hypothetical protein